MEGSGFFAPQGGQVQFELDIENNSFQVVACQRNYGQFMFGILDLHKVLNQPYVIETESFQIYMTTLDDITFSKPYQQIITGFNVDTSQYRPGDMKGRVVAQNTLVQTYSSLDFILEPTMDLSENSYIKINIPNTLQFQGPSCAVTNIQGEFS